MNSRILAILSESRSEVPVPAAEHVSLVARHIVFPCEIQFDHVNVVLSAQVAGEVKTLYTQVSLLHRIQTVVQERLMGNIPLLGAHIVIIERLVVLELLFLGLLGKD